MFRTLLRSFTSANTSRLISQQATKQCRNGLSRNNYVKEVCGGLIVSAVLCQPLDKVKKQDLREYEIDLSIYSANESSFMNLINVLKENIVNASLEYRKCLHKQIEITKAATKLGHFSQRWDDIPQYRLLAAELKDELDKYFALLKTLGKIASDESFAEILPKPNESMTMITLRYREVEKILMKELKENKKVELELLKVNRDSIDMMTNVHCES